METSQIVKQIDNIKSTYRCRAPRGAKYRIDVLWTYDVAAGDKLFVSGESAKDGDTEALEASIDDFNAKLDELSRNDAVGRLTVKITDLNRRNPECYTVVLREAYASYPVRVQTEMGKRPTAAEEQQVMMVRPQERHASPFGGLGSILGLLAGDMGGLGDVNDGEASKELQGLHALLNFRDQRKDEQYARAKLTERNESLEQQLREAQEREAQLKAAMKAQEEKFTRELDAARQELRKMEEAMEDLKSDNEEMTERLHKANPDNSIFGVSMSQLGGRIAHAALENFARSHAGLVGSLMGVGKDQFLGMLDERNYQQEDENGDTDDENAPEVSVDMDGADDEALPATEPARAQDPISTYTDSLAQWLRNADDNTRNKFTAIIQEIAKDSNALDDVYNMTVTQ